MVSANNVADYAVYFFPVFRSCCDSYFLKLVFQVPEITCHIISPLPF